MDALHHFKDVPVLKMHCAVLLLEGKIHNNPNLCMLYLGDLLQHLFLSDFLYISQDFIFFFFRACCNFNTSIEVLNVFIKVMIRTKWNGLIRYSPGRFTVITVINVLVTVYVPQLL